MDQEPVLREILQGWGGGRSGSAGERGSTARCSPAGDNTGFPAAESPPSSMGTLYVNLSQLANQRDRDVFVG